MFIEKGKNRRKINIGKWNASQISKMCFIVNLVFSSYRDIIPFKIHIKLLSDTEEIKIKGYNVKKVIDLHVLKTTLKFHSNFY
jgi:hypothetical protein